MKRDFYQKITASCVFSNIELLGFLIYLFLNCEKKQKTISVFGQKIKVKKGQFLTSRINLSFKLQISDSKIYRFLNILEQENFIKQNKTSQYTIITVIDYFDFSTNSFFQPPTLAEISNFIQLKNYKNVDPEVFFNFYQSKNWQVGSSKMKNWRSAVTGWEARSNKNIKQKNNNLIVGRNWLGLETVNE